MNLTIIVIAVAIIIVFAVVLIRSTRAIGDISTKRLHMKFNNMKVDPFLVGGVSVSIIVALVLVLLNHEGLISAAIALLGVVITLQIEQIIRLDKGLQEHARHTDLWHKVDSTPLLKSLMPEIIESALAVARADDELFVNCAKLELANIRNYFQSLVQGYLRTPYNDIEPLLLATQKAKHNIRAISVFKVDEWFWEIDIGERYWSDNQEAMRRGVKIERIFICDTLTDALKALAKKQADAGIQVYTAIRGQLPDDLRQDMIVFDHNFTYKALINADGVPIQNELSTNDADINQKIEDFNRARALAHKYSTGT